MFYVLCFTVPLQNKLKFFKFITHLHYPVNSSPSSEFAYVCIARASYKSQEDIMSLVSCAVYHFCSELVIYVDFHYCVI